MSGDSDVHVFLQFKNTDICVDLFCACDGQIHFDGYFADELTCGNCGQTWKLPHSLLIEPVEPSRGFKIVYDDREVIEPGEFDAPWPRPEFSAVKPGGIFEIHDDIDGGHRSAYVDFIRATSNGDGTMTLRVRNRGVSP